MSAATSTRYVMPIVYKTWPRLAAGNRDAPDGNLKLRPTVYQPSGTKGIDPPNGVDRSRFGNVVARNVGRRRYPATRPGCGNTPPGFFV